MNKYWNPREEICCDAALHNLFMSITNRISRTECTGEVYLEKSVNHTYIVFHRFTNKHYRVWGSHVTADDRFKSVGVWQHYDW